MMKNVEWGATAYLAHSKYGLNGEEICTNSNNNQITGMGSGNKTYIGNATHPYDTAIGKKSSTTNNIYGIYDMSGGSNEHTAACLTGKTNKINSTADSKYIDVYTNYSIQKYGDAIYETSNGINSPYTDSWFKDYSRWIESNDPVYIRGGKYAPSVATSGGLFYFYCTDGTAYNNGSFRPTLVVY